MSRPKKSRARKQADAKERAEVVLKVQSGQITATEGAQELGMSRKSYYKWEKRALAGMVEALCEQNSGRPALEIDEEKEAMRKKILELEKELKLTKAGNELRQMLDAESEKKE
jgi:transposase-like protein